MMKKLITFICLTAFAVALLIGCASENEAPTAPSVDQGDIERFEE